MGDLATFRREFPIFTPFLSPGIRSGIGGVAVLIHRNLCAQAVHIEEKVILPGRALMVTITTSTGKFAVISIHLEPGISKENTAAVLNLIKAAIIPDSIMLLGGDFNFVSSGDSQLCIPTGTLTIRCDPAAELFDSILPDFTEIAQDDFTHITTINGTASTMARLDRFYTNMCELDLLDSMPFARTIHNLYQKQRLSDHSAVSLAFNPALHNLQAMHGTPYCSIAPWVAQNGLFLPHFTELYMQYKRYFTSDAYHNLTIIKDIMHGAATLTKDELAIQQCAATVQERRHWTTKCMRALRTGNWFAVLAAVKAYPALENAVDIDSYHVKDHVWMQAHLRQLALEDIDTQLNDTTSSTPSTSTSTTPQPTSTARQIHQVTKLMHLRRLWTSSGKRLSLAAITEDGNDIPASSPEAAAALARHWGKIFDQPTTAIDIPSGFDMLIPRLNNPIFDVTLNKVYELLGRLQHSAPGPDGVPYAAWTATADITAGYLHAALLSLLAGCTPPHTFNSSFMVFLPKGGDAPGPSCSSRTPSATRPLNLSNTDQKILAKLIDKELSQMIYPMLHEAQHGFIKGISIIDAVGRLESEALTRTTLAGNQAAMLLLDLKAAFPSLRQDYIFHVLQLAGIPQPMLQAIRALYHNNVAQIKIVTPTASSIRLQRGIRQGCPLSGTLWILLFDPILRYMMQHFGPSTSLVAYADDIGLATSRMLDTLRMLITIINLIDKLAGLSMNWDKVVVIPLWTGASIADCENILRALPQHAHRLKVLLAGRYLGVLLGPEAHLSAWTETCIKIKERARRLRDLKLPFVPSIRLYNIFIATLPSHILQFHKPNGKLKQAITTTLATITATPHHSIPEQVYTRLQQLGFPIQVPHLERVSLATRSRAWITSCQFQDFPGKMEQALAHPDALLHFDRGWWLQHSVQAQVQEAADQVHPVRVLHPYRHLSPLPTQALLYKHLHSQAARTELIRAVATRIVRWVGPQEAEASACRAIQLLSSMKRIMPTFVCAAYLKTLMNAWPTPYRFGMAVDCPFCGTEPAGAKIEHILACPAMRSAAAPFLLHWLRWPLSGGCKEALGLDMLPGTPEAYITFAWHDLIMQAFFAMHHGDRASLASLLRGRLRVLCRRSPILKATFKNMHRSPH